MECKRDECEVFAQESKTYKYTFIFDVGSNKIMQNIKIIYLERHIENPIYTLFVEPISDDDISKNITQSQLIININAIYDNLNYNEVIDNIHISNVDNTLFSQFINNVKTNFYYK